MLLTKNAGMAGNAQKAVLTMSLSDALAETDPLAHVMAVLHAIPADLTNLSMTLSKQIRNTAPCWWMPEPEWI